VFENRPRRLKVLADGVVTVAKVVALTRRVDGVGRGSLRGQLVTATDWDSDEVKDAIARDFGALP
jgi:hypothetical protein